MDNLERVWVQDDEEVDDAEPEEVEERLSQAQTFIKASDYENGLYHAMAAALLYDVHILTQTGELTTRDRAIKEMAYCAVKLGKYSLASYLCMMSMMSCNAGCAELACIGSGPIVGGICALLDNNFLLAGFAYNHPATSEADKALLGNLITAVQDRNLELFMTSCATRTQISLLDPLIPTLLLRLKNTLY